MIRTSRTRDRRTWQAVVALAVVGIVTCAFGGVAFAVTKVSASPSPVTLAEGGVQVVTFSLDEPIIAMTPNPTVVATFTVTDPTSRLQVSTPSLTWTASTWFQPLTVTLQSIPDGIHDATNAATVDVAVTSEAAYYNGFSTSVAVTLGDPDPAPVTTTTNATDPTTTTTTPAPTTTVSTDPPSTVIPTIRAGPAANELPRTGARSGDGAAGALVPIVVGSALAFAGGSRRRRKPRS